MHKDEFSVLLLAEGEDIAIAELAPPELVDAQRIDEASPFAHAAERDIRRARGDLRDVEEGLSRPLLVSQLDESRPCHIAVHFDGGSPPPDEDRIAILKEEIGELSLDEEIVKVEIRERLAAPEDRDLAIASGQRIDPTRLMKKEDG